MSEYNHQEFVHRCLGFPLLFRSTRTLSLFVSISDCGFVTVRGTVVYVGGGFAILADVVLLGRGVLFDYILIVSGGGFAVGERIDANLVCLQVDALRFVFGNIEVLDGMDCFPIVRDWVYSHRGRGGWSSSSA